jgi:hypothetical protein
MGFYVFGWFGGWTTINELCWMDNIIVEGRRRRRTLLGESRCVPAKGSRRKEVRLRSLMILGRRGRSDKKMFRLSIFKVNLIEVWEVGDLMFIQHAYSFTHSK